MTGQIPLDLRVPPALGREDYLIAPSNAAAVAMLDAPRDWPGGRLLLIGPAGAGKSHLAGIWAAGADAQVLDGPALDAGAVAALAGAARPVLIEDADGPLGAAAEEALFHLWNLSGPARPLLITARRPPRDWGLSLADLRSRLDTAAQARLEAPDDGLLRAVLVKLFADRQIVISAALVDWLAQRMERSLGDARALVAAVDQAALARKAPVTRALLAEVLEITRRFALDGNGAALQQDR
ncbi:chromosomal replication initiator DnaA [Paracoccus pacificus]|uniref:Chromosomal replication initiator DnaA n=1 Tax=Paracoccus pacificus TaxID=1463598 RepID=A0ABW4RAF7_9RHOB